MKNLIYLLLLVFAVSCEELEENSSLSHSKIYSADFKELEHEQNLEIINIDSIKNFAELRSEMGRLTCEKKVSGLKFTANQKEYYLTGFAGCPTSRETACYFRRNHIVIKNDSLVTDLFHKKKEPIEYLGEELSNMTSHSYNFEFDEDKMRPALIHLYIDEAQPISTTKKVLKEIVEEFETINSGSPKNFFTYHILFESFDRTNIPPPPPPPQSATE